MQKEKIRGVKQAKQDIKQMRQVHGKAGEKRGPGALVKNTKKRDEHFIFMHFGLVSGTQLLEQGGLGGPSPERYLALGIRLVRDVCDKEKSMAWPGVHS